MTLKLQSRPQKLRKPNLNVMRRQSITQIQCEPVRHQFAYHRYCLEEISGIGGTPSILAVRFRRAEARLTSPNWPTRTICGPKWTSMRLILGRLGIGSPAAVVLDSYPDKQFDAALVKVYPRSRPPEGHGQNRGPDRSAGFADHQAGNERQGELSGAQNEKWR